MKTEEDEAFDDLARKQGMWGGGFQAKRQMAADKLLEPVHCQCPACKDGVLHASDCAVHTGPAYSLGPCDCGVEKESEILTIVYQSGYYDGKQAALAGREWVGLTDEETQAYWDWEDWQTGAGRSTILEMVRDIEAKLKEKNA